MYNFCYELEYNNQDMDMFQAIDKLYALRLLHKKRLSAVVQAKVLLKTCTHL